MPDGLASARGLVGAVLAVVLAVAACQDAEVVGEYPNPRKGDSTPYDYKKNPNDSLFGPGGLSIGGGSSQPAPDAATGGGIGVNTFLSDEGSPTVIPSQVIRATPEEKAHQIEQVVALKSRWTLLAQQMLGRMQETAVGNTNLFALLMEAAKVCSLGQITQALYEVGGQYRRNM